MPVYQDACQWTCRRDGCRSPPPTSLAPPEQIYNKQFFLGKRVVQSHKQAISHISSLPLAPKFQTTKNTHKQVGRGAPGTHTPLLTQSRAPCFFRGQFPSLNRKRKHPVSKARGGAGQVPETSKFGSCWKRPRDLPGNSWHSTLSSQWHSAPCSRKKGRSWRLGDLTPAWTLNIVPQVRPSCLLLKKPIQRAKSWV